MDGEVLFAGTAIREMGAPYPVRPRTRKVFSDNALGPERTSVWERFPEGTNQRPIEAESAWPEFNVCGLRGPGRYRCRARGRRKRWKVNLSPLRARVNLSPYRAANCKGGAAGGDQCHPIPIVEREPVTS